MLEEIAHLKLREQAPLSEYTRFGIGGPARLYAETSSERSFIAALSALRSSGERFVVIGGGTNLIVSDAGFPGVVLRFTAAGLKAEGNRVHAEAGAELQALVDFTIDGGLAGIHTMTGIPGSVGAAVYGNAGAYGNSISSYVREVRFFDGARVRTFSNAECDFRYRESAFKKNKDWIIFAAALELVPGDTHKLRERADEIRAIRDRKYPPTMKCAGSIFKNLLLNELPDSVRDIVPPCVVIEGKVPSAYFLEQVGAKGVVNGDIHVAEYHANLIYNGGGGTARQVREVIHDLKQRVRERFGFDLEEEVQYVGFPNNGSTHRAATVRERHS
jgi:UDP-N-acetylmuramate dehydrogenase